ncbi:type VII secretion protein EccCa [Hoyosella rhizosphaerae]|uniref:FtsK/SpoIIIE family protein n=1 Tax=Hoyosella rhizosphaerae TaxID=1755582 RepID=A0A916UBG8_9ACTN|nr:type VII secretion protein EccCa [Hoyosella rhizosphaerae]MBN4926176.1 type VII secretion protein EccCa [Hoyosella rhizosphaerae]GGC64920.1 putative FtsK/SpoIIIE family protein [Hoyosella rhizosphaerae]
MGAVHFVRSGRIDPPQMPGGELGLNTPPEVPRAIPGNLIQKLLPVVMVLAMVGMVALMFRSGMLANPMMLMFPVMMAVSMVGMLAGSGGRGGGARTAELNEQRKDYLRYLCDTRRDVVDAADQQRAAVVWHHPAPNGLWSIAGSPRMWERTADDSEYLSARIGYGAQRLSLSLVPPETGPTDDLEPISVVALRRFVRTHSIVPDLPIALSMRGFASVTIRTADEGSEADEARGLVRSIICQLCAFHSPDDVRVVVVCGDEQVPDWDWVKWLPHNQHPHLFDDIGPQRMVYTSLHSATADLSALLEGRPRFVRGAPIVGDQTHLVFVMDSGVVDGDESLISGDGFDGVTLIDIDGSCESLSDRQGLSLIVSDGQIGAMGTTGAEMFAMSDQMGAGFAQMTSMALSRFRVAPQGMLQNAHDPSSAAFPDWATMIGAGDVARFDTDVCWRPRRGRDRLRVPVGFAENGSVVEIDLKESAEKGMGPHGLCVGATGSGKSEFLRTLVLGLIATHSPESLNLVLVDFKGGATFLGLEGAPHVAAIITNLADEITMVDRMRDALEGEMNRRQQLLRQAGNYASVAEYERARQSGAPLDPMPAMFIVVDEFSELLSQKPDFADLFVMIGRLGRSLQMHLLLASQRLDEGRLRGLESHLSYRIGLKTFSAQESRAVLGVPDAYHLPAVPGAGFLKVDSAEPVRFSAAYVSGSYEPPLTVEVQKDAVRSLDLRVVPFTARPSHCERDDNEIGKEIPQRNKAETVVQTKKKTVLELVLDGVRGRGVHAHEVWLPPLTVSPTVGQLVPPAHRVSAGGGSLGALRVPIGLIDRPYDQRRDPLFIDVSGGQGNIAIVGGPQSGKSTAVRTVIMALAASHTPADVQFYCLDFGGGALASVAGLPHVGSVASRLEPDRIRRTVAEVTAVMRQREKLFQQRGIGSMSEYRRTRAAESASDADVSEHSKFGDVFLIVDGWATVRQEFEELESSIAALASQGLSFGVHVLVTATRWSDLRIGIKDQLGTRIELRLGDPNDSEMNRKVAALVPDGQPGRGLTKEGLHMLVAVPTFVPPVVSGDLTEAISSAVKELRDVSAGAVAPPVRMLPEQFPRDELDLDHAASNALNIPIALNENELRTVGLDFASQPHLVVFADAESGKTTLLRSMCAGIMERNTPAQAKILLADFRRTMLGVVDTDHLAGYAVSAANLQAMIAELGGVLRQRLPGPDTTQQQLRDRSWWSGPEVFVIVDDYDLVATTGGNPLSGLLELLPQAKDVGLHLVIARRTGGASRALFEPVMASLRDLSPMGLVMNGSRDEGVLVGNVRAAEHPPGRGVLVTRSGGEQRVQLAWMPPL